MIAYIMVNKGDERSTHSHYHYHTIVLSRLLAAKHRILPDFHNLDNRYVYDKSKNEWIEK